MGYSTKFEIATELASALTSGDPNAVVVSTLSLGNSLTDTVPDVELNQIIRWADQLIDAKISSIYRTPLDRISTGQFKLLTPVNLGDMLIMLLDSTRFTPGDVILLRGPGASQEFTVADVPNENEITLTTPASAPYAVNLSRVERIAYPDPIPKISARFAAANIYDKHFAAQVEPNQSDYGDNLRTLATADINGILSGVNRLKVADAGEMVGRRYCNMALLDVPNTAAEPGKEWFKS